MLPVIRFLIIISLHIFLQLSLRLINLIVLALRIIYVFFRYLLHSVKEVVTGAITTGKEFKPVFSAKETKKEKPETVQVSMFHFPRITIRRIMAALLLIYLFLMILGYFFWKYILSDLPSPEKLTQRNVAVSTKIYDRNGILLYNIYKDENRSPVALSETPLHVRLATLAIEDAEFYKHPGFSIRGIIRAAVINFQEGELTGGSTITQQLVKNTLLTPEKTVQRKLKEIVLAVMVELTYSKDEILEMYLNQVSYGGTAYGIQEASRVYFGKNVDELTLGEAAILAGLPKSPTEYSPFGQNPEKAKQRQKEVLNLMRINGFITEGQEKKANEEQITFTQNLTNIKAPHFVMYVRQILEEKYGKEVVETGGLDVITTLDYQIQKMAENVVADEVAKLSPLNVTNGAAMVVNPQTGEILAMVGSTNYFDTQNDGNVNITLRLRQPGSSIKLVNYAYALSNGYTPATILKDTPVTLKLVGSDPYTPKNYDGKFRGNLTLRSAFAESRNVPAVKVLDSYGVDKMIETGKKMGITTWINPANYGLSLTLGGGDVRLIDLTQAYETVANYGNKITLNPIEKVINFEGKVLEQNPCANIETKSRFNVADGFVKSVQSSSGCTSEQVLDPRVSYMLIDILKDNVARSPAFGRNSLLNIPNHTEVAVKTGTSNNLRDNLAIGFNQDYLVSAWVGNNDNSQMSRIASGVTGATPIFNMIMTALLADSTNHEWEVPDGLVKVEVCKYTGTLPCEGCPTYSEWFLKETIPTQRCNPDLIKSINEVLSKDSQGFVTDEAVSTQGDQ